MKLSKQTKNILIGFLAIAAVFVAYTYWFKDSGEVDPVLATSGAPSTVGADFVALLYQLKAIRLDTNLFSDPVFGSLENFGVIIAPEPIGNPTPFAPMPSDSSQR